MTWDGKDRRREERSSEDNAHDTLIRIDTNLSNFMKRYEDHLLAHKEDMEKIDKNIKEVEKRTLRLEKWIWMAAGAITVLEIILKINEK
jgi:hypothetical protein